MRGRTTSPNPGRAPSPGPPLPPSYARSHLDRSPSSNPTQVPKLVPPPIFLRSSSPSSISSKGSLKIHIPAWGIVIIRPPAEQDLHPLDSGISGQLPPAEDYVLTGALEVVMKERRRVLGISVGVMSVCRLYMGVAKGWEEDGVFERGVEVVSGDEDGIWLEKGSQSFSFSILLPATLAVHDYHQFARISYMLTARVEGIPSKSMTSMFKGKEPASDVQFKEDFDNVIQRSTDMVQDMGLQRQSSRGSVSSASGVNGATTSFNSLSLERSNSSSGREEGGLLFAGGEGSPTLTGLYHRRSSNESLQRPPLLSLGSSPLACAIDDSDRDSVRSVNTVGETPKSEKNGWLKGDLIASRGLIIHANPSTHGGVPDLNIRKEGFVDGLGGWRFMVSADVFTISAVVLLSMTIPKPSSQTTIFLLRLLLTQSYTLTSPRRPNDKPFQPEAAKHHVLYQIGRPHKSGEKIVSHNAESLWRGSEAGGPILSGNSTEEEGWKIRAVARLPAHEKIRATTHVGSITPIRVTHTLLLQVFYSVEGETVTGEPMNGPGELRMMMVKLPITIPSCCCTGDALTLPTYNTDPQQPNIDQILLNPPTKPTCACGHTFAELGEAQMKRLQLSEQDDMEAVRNTRPSSRSRPGSGHGRDNGSGREMGDFIDEERARWARREQKDREARSRSRYD